MSVYPTYSKKYLLQITRGTTLPDLMTNIYAQIAGGRFLIILYDTGRYISLHLELVLRSARRFKHISYRVSFHVIVQVMYTHSQISCFVLIAISFTIRDSP